MKPYFNILLALVMTLWSVGSYAFSAPEFNEEAFKTAQATDKVILVDVFASWCPTCKAQGKDLENILKDSKFSGVVTFKVDFDNKDVVKALERLAEKKIPRQSTILFFKGKELIAFSVSERDAKLRTHLEKAVEATKK